MIKILIAEHDTILREALNYIINEQDDMEVAGVTDNTAQAPKLCRTLKPGLLLMGVATEHVATETDLNDLMFAAQIRRELPDIKIVVMSMGFDITLIEAAMKAGVHSYVSINKGKNHLLSAIRRTIQGDTIYPSSERLQEIREIQEKAKEKNRERNKKWRARKKAERKQKEVSN